MDFIPVYTQWLKAVKQESSQEMFRLWLYSLSDQQLDEVVKKWDKFQKFWSGFNNINFYAIGVKTDRMDYSLLSGEHLAAPLDDPSYYSILINVCCSNDSFWYKVESKHLEKATYFYNAISSNYKPFFDKKTAELCKNIIAERELLETKT